MYEGCDNIMDNEKKLMDTDKFLNTLIKMAESMQNCGSEVYRTEDTLRRIGRAYRSEEIDVFVIISNIILTLKMRGEEAKTRSRRLDGSSGNDFAKLERLNALSRSVCAHPIAPEEFDKAIDEINNTPKSDAVFIAGSMLASGSFAVFYGGSVIDGIISALIGILIYNMQKYLSPVCLNKFAFQLCASLIAGFCAFIAIKLIPGTHIDKIMIGDIMLLVPGVMFTNAVRDMLLGDTLSGILRLIEALLLAAMMTMGFLVSLLLAGHV